MTPAIGIGFLSLTGILFIAYILFLVEQNKLQDELARHCKQEDDARGAPIDRLNPVIEVWICPECGFMSTVQSFCIHCSSPRPHEITYLRVGLKEYAEQPGHVPAEGVQSETQVVKAVRRKTGWKQVQAF